MSYNLMAEGDLDLFELGSAASRYQPLELFPILADEVAAKPDAQNRIMLQRDALGIAVPTSRCGPEAVAALRALVKLLWSKDAAVFDLYSGRRISTPEDLEESAAQIGP